MLRRGGRSRRNEDGGEDEGAGGQALEALPSEQDRKATMGCLAAVLNIMFSYEHRREVQQRGADDDPGGVEEGGIEASFAVRGSDDSDNNSSQSTSRRRDEFQKELLRMSAGLLFLSPEYATLFLPNLDIQCASDEQERQLLLEPYLESISNAEEAFRCIALLLFRFLLLSSSDGTDPPAAAAAAADNPDSGASNDEKKTIVGYDARVRVAFKCLAVSILSHWEQRQHQEESKEGESASALRASHALMDTHAHATRKFGALEDGIAERLLMISKYVQENQRRKDGDGEEGKPGGGSSSLTTGRQQKKKSVRKSVVRGLKIGAAGVAGGTLLAVTGGMAAPALVAGIATVTGAGLISTAAIALLTFPATVTIFGIGGGTLVAKKMKTRTKGLSEFQIQKVEIPDKDVGIESGRHEGREDECSSSSPEQELSRTVCISGWLTDEHDFQRPFGVTPDTLTDRHEVLCRFCSVYAPDVLPKCRAMLKLWKGKEDELWELLRNSYGKDPDSLLPLSGPRQDAALSDSENEAVDGLIPVLGLPVPAPHEIASNRPPKQNSSAKLPPPLNLLSDVLPRADVDDDSVATTTRSTISETSNRAYKAWDFHAQYGGEQYTVRWEKNLLLQLNNSAKEFTADLVKTAAGEALKRTAMESIMAAVALPATVLSLSNIIDEKWTLVAERADEAGILLAQSLLDSDAGHRPVSLVGFSFGARIILSCLQELSRHQTKWEEQAKAAAAPEQAAKKQSSVYTREPASIVEDVVLMGCPASASPSTWSACRRVVAGRLVNCYSKNDLILKLLYRIKNKLSVLNPPIGIVSVDIAGVENFDVSALVASHGEYCVAAREILEEIGHDQPRPVSKTPDSKDNHICDEGVS